jgi:hypothetical protein
LGALPWLPAILPETQLLVKHTVSKVVDVVPEGEGSTGTTTDGSLIPAVVVGGEDDRRWHAVIEMDVKADPRPSATSQGSNLPTIKARLCGGLTFPVCVCAF